MDKIGGTAHTCQTMRVLIVEDDARIAANLYDFLEARGHACGYASSSAEAARMLTDGEFDALILDLGLPDGDGLGLARRLRAGGSGLPVLMLTARDTLEDKLAGFDAGADDYLVKPFALREVEARLLALTRRGPQRTDAGVWRFGALEYNAAAKEIRLGSRPLRLAPKALKLLALLVQQPDRVFSRRELEISIWGREQDSGDNLRSVMHAVRKALGEGGGVSIANMHGLGYKLTADA